MVTLTEKAAGEVGSIIKRKKEAAEETGVGLVPLYLRVGVKGGGCSGFSYTLDLTETITEHDERSTQYDVDVICDPKSLLYLEGTTIDFKDELMGRGFVFENPNAAGCCGCGASFSA